MVNLNRAICPYCRRVFAKEKDDQRFCSFLCEKSESGQFLPGERKKVQPCAECGKLCNKKYCSDACRFGNRVLQTSQVEKARMEANQAWVKEKPKRKSITLSHQELNRRSEYRRKWDDEGWKHYLKGRKWDRI